MASKPKLPTFADGTAFVEDLEQICAAVRAITPIPGGTVTPHITAAGTYFTGGTGSGGLIPVVVPSSIASATFTTSGMTPAPGSCYRVLRSGSAWVYATSSEPINNWYPDPVTGPGFGWATTDPIGVLALVTISCTKIPAVNPSPAPTQTTPTGTSTGVNTSPPLPTAPKSGGSINTFAAGVSSSLSLSTGGGAALAPIAPPPPP